MSNTRTITDKALSHRLVVDVLEEQTGNMTQIRDMKKGVNIHVYEMLSKVARRAIQCSLATQSVERPNLNDADWQHTFANQTERAMLAAGFDADIRKYANWFEKTMPKAIGGRASIDYMYMKIATYAGQCANMLLHRLDPELLTQSYEEAMEQLLELASSIDNSIIIVLPD